MHPSMYLIIDWRDFFSECSVCIFFFFSEKAWSKEDKARETQLMSDLVTIIEQRNQIINSLDQDRQRWANYI